MKNRCLLLFALFTWSSLSPLVTPESRMSAPSATDTTEAPNIYDAIAPFVQHASSSEGHSLDVHTLKLLARHDAHARTSGDVLFAPSSWDALSLFQGKNNALSAIDRTQTLFGKYYLAKLLVTPTTDIARITQRQDLIMALCKDEKLTTQLRTMRKQLGEKQEKILKLTDESHPIYDPGYKAIFHKRHFRQLSSWISNGFSSK